MGNFYLYFLQRLHEQIEKKRQTQDEWADDIKEWKEMETAEPNAKAAENEINGKKIIKKSSILPKEPAMLHVCDGLDRSRHGVISFYILCINDFVKYMHM